MSQNVAVFDPNPPQLPLARHPLYATTSPDVARTKLSQALVPRGPLQQVHPQLDKSLGEFHCIHNSVGLPKVSINAISYGSPVVLGLRDVEKLLFFVLVLQGECRISSGENRFIAGSGEMFVINAGQQIQAELSSDFQEIVVAMDIDALTPVILRMIDRPISVPIRFNCCPLPLNSPGGSVVRFLRMLCAEMDAEEHTGGFDSISELYEQTLLTLMLTSLPHNYSDWLHRGVPAAIPYYVRRAERFIRDNIRAPLTLDEIVAASDTGRRSLHLGFREFRRTTPMLFLKECRLQYAKTLLEDQHQAHRPIAQVAHEAGFEHPSKFSHAYKSRFGELPSDTRRRRCPD